MRIKVICLLILLTGGVISSSYGGILTSVTATPNKNQAGVATSYTFDFTTDISGIPADGKIVITFPPAFDVTDADIAQTTNSGTMDGGFLASGAGGVITLVRDGTGTAVIGGATVGVRVAVINNHETAGDYSVDIETQLSDATPIDSGTSTDFTIIHNTLAYFQFDTIVDQTAGLNFDIKITARDQYGNQVNTFAGTASLSDLTATIYPAATTDFISGSWTGNVQITQTVSNNEITVNAQNKSGTSNQFNVLAGGADHFTFDFIASSKTAGQSFQITITARDVNENIATSFSSTANLSDNTGTIDPLATTGFTNGEWTGNVTITKSQDDVEITTAQGGINGASNTFNVQPSVVDHFSINNISTQAADELFVITVTALDTYYNIANQFTGKVDISESTATINPTESGNFTNGVWSGSVVISQSVNNNIISVKNQAGSESGSSNTFDVISGGVDHFAILDILDQVAGQSFSITIRAEDSANNLVTDFSGTGVLSDLTGSLSPTMTGNFSGGSWTGNVTVIKSYSVNSITITSSGKSGTSNTFDVDPAALDYFDFSEIGSPQTAGASFGITIVAKDQFDNQVTGFAGVVNFSENTATISPGTSNNFVNGSWTGNVTITGSTMDNVIIANGSGKSGESNKFNVIASSLSYFVLAPISTQAAGEPFIITVTAQDAFGNVVTQYSGKVDISDKTSKISPAESGNFSNGQWIGSVAITQVYSADVITVVNQGGGETGNSDSFDVISSDVDHFVISTINNQTAGQAFSMMIRAEDASNNLVTTFTGTANLSDLTTTISPVTTGSFLSGEWIGNVTITKSRTGNTITVTSSGKSKISNPFTVSPAALDHFTISDIGSPQTAGQSFSITVTAEDQYDNKVTSFTGVVTISENTATISPTVSGNFVAGSWTDNVSITQTVIDNIIEVSSSGKNGQSNKFNVNPSSLHHFVLRTIATQAAGEPFSVYVTAQDVHNNTATQFIGKVDISDETGTITPNESSNFNNGIWVGIVVITQSSANNEIIVVNQGGSESGASNLFDVIFSNVDHFIVEQIGSQQAGQAFSVTIRAEDSENNLVTDFSGTATLSDYTGSISPTTTTDFASGLWIGDITITKSYTGNKIIVTSSGRGGTSDPFNVSPAALDHFTFDEISSLKVAGTPFQITIYAEDFYYNQVASFNTYVNLSDETGTIDPTSTPNFTNGSWSGNVELTKSQSNVKITGTRNGKTGETNIFNVNPGSLTSFDITEINTQAAGEPFLITATALDADSNVATQFLGTVDISDLTDTISPQVSNNFEEGKWTGNVTVSQGKQDNIITVTNSGGSETGQSNSFNITSGSLDHFFIETISSPQTAGVLFTITIRAQDADSNTVAEFTDIASLSDATGTIDPTNTGNFVDGIWSGEVSITKYLLNDSITVTNGGKAGTSNSFSVTHNTLDHFEVDDISSPQIAGISFLFSITAKDEYDNVVLNYNSMANLFDNTNTIFPTQTGSFSNGVWSGNVEITKSQKDVQITVDDNGKSGQSNLFNVNSGPLYYLKIMDSAGGKGQEVDSLSLSLNDKITLYAAGFDEHSNYSHDVKATWGVDGTIDPPSPTFGEFTVFDPVTPRTVGKIYADTTGIAADSTGQIDAGTPAYVKIQNAPGKDGDEIYNHTMTADDSLFLYCEVYDIGGANVGEESVQWLSTGDLAPEIYETGTSINFNPTIAPAFGRIIADHLSILDDSTGVVTVLPGVPVGDIYLTAVPPVIAADGISSSVISSGYIYDGGGNKVAENTQFTVRSTLGTITTTDVNLTLPGIQITADDDGKIQFNLQSNMMGGNALITVNSVNGSAYGELTILLSSLNIISISSPKQAVSLGQNNVQINMVVENKGSSTIFNLGAGLIFTGPAPANENRNGDFPNVERVDGVSNIPGGSMRTLSFNVDVRANAATDTITIDGWISGEINGETVADTSADTTWKWVVQTAADLRITKVHSLLNEVSQGMAAINISMYVVNEGEASATVALDTLKFWSVNHSNDVTGEYVIVPSGGNPTLILGERREQFDFSVSVGVAATLGQTLINGSVAGTDINSGDLITDDTADTTHSWLVKEAAIVGIKGFYTTQLRVTSGQTAPWNLKMIVENNGGTSVRFDSTRLVFSLRGGDVSSEYDLNKATKFKKSGNTILSANSVDTLIYTINKTGTSVGDITIRGTIYLKELGTNNAIIDEAVTGVKVQAPAEIKILSLTPSQNSVTYNQSQNWSIKLAIENEGGTDIEVDVDTSKSFIGFTTGTDFEVNYPASLDGGGLILEAGFIDTLTFIVTKTGATAGNCDLSAQVTGYQTTSGDQKMARDDLSNLVVVEAPARLRILSVINNAPNSPKVNTEQVFPIHVILENIGQDQVAEATVNLSSSGNSIDGTISFTFTDIPGDSGKKEQIFNITADNNAVQSEIFSAEIANARAQNTSESLGLIIEPSLDSTETVTIQEPATFEIMNIVAPDSVAASQLIPWQIKVVLTNNGEAGAVIGTPSGNDVTITANEEVQNDYIIELPDSLSGGGFVLSGGSVDTLIYTVTSTGASSGLDSIKVSLQASDQNNQQILPAQKGKSFRVVSIAGVQLLKTSPVCHNVIGEKGFVNRGQTFTIKTWIHNLVRKDLTNIKVNLTSNGQSTILQSQKTITSLKYQQTEFVEFDIQANFNDINENEVFTSMVVAPVIIDNDTIDIVNIDNIAEVATQDPAQLKVEAWTADSLFKVNQQFQVKANVRNEGTFPAQVDDSGQLILNVPEDYRVIVGEDTLQDNSVIIFNQETTYDWTVLSPKFQSGPDTLRVSILHTPRDKNINQTAQVIQRSDTVIISAVETVLNMFVVSPEGAKDRILSTNQSFTIQANVNYSETFENVRASLYLPQGAPEYQFVSPGDSMQYVYNRNDSIRWELKAPDIAADNFRSIEMKIRYNEKGDPTIKDMTVNIEVKTIIRAELELSASISGPADAKDGIVSVNQEFELQAQLINHGQADFEDSYKMELILPADYLSIDDLVKIVVGNEIVKWQVKAPSSANSVKNIEIRVPPGQGPNDENTRQEAHWQNNRSVSIPITTGEKTVFISKLPSRTSNIVVKGQSNISLMGLIINNPAGDGNSSSVILTGFEITAQDKDGNNISNPGLTISRIAACKYNQTNIVYGAATDFSTGSRMTINFTQPDTIIPGQSDSVDILIDIKNKPEIKNFMISFSPDTCVHIREAQTLNTPVITTGPGEAIFQSDFVVILGDNLKESFLNYPNPFGDADNPTTTITYYLKQDTDVDIKIYTLIGELVWSRSFTKNDTEGKEGPHDGDLTWNAKNDRGYKVLNGVYVIYLKTGYGESVTTKAAVIK